MDAGRSIAEAREMLWDKVRGHVIGALCCRRDGSRCGYIWHRTCIAGLLQAAAAYDSDTAQRVKLWAVYCALAEFDPTWQFPRAQ